MGDVGKVLVGAPDSGTDIGGSLGHIVDPVDAFGIRQGQEAIESSERLGMQSLGMQQEWMDYLKSTYEPYAEVAEQALGAQAGLAGLQGTGVQRQMVSDIQADPLYQAKIREGEEAVLRHQAATGGLRSGAASQNLAALNQAALSQEIAGRQQQLAGLSGQGFMGTSGLTGQGGQLIDQMTGTLGTIASGQIAGASAAQQRGAGLMSGLGSMAAAFFSDERLKTNIRKIGEKNGIPLYRWEWNEIARDKFGLDGESEGHMATDVEINYPYLVTEKDGYRMVNYGGFENGV